MNRFNFYNKVSKMSNKKLLAYFKSSINGLNNEQVIMKQQEYGKNTIDYNDNNTLLNKVIKAFINPFTIILIIIAIISFTTEYLLVSEDDKSLIGVIIIVSMIIVSGVITFYQNIKSNKVFSKLNLIASSKCMVIRDNQKYDEIDESEIVVGDLVKLTKYNSIPADLVLLESDNLYLSQAKLTGESNIINKQANIEDIEYSNIFELPNIVYMGSDIVSGSGIAMVIATKPNTEFGKIIKDLSNNKIETNFDKEMSKISFLLIKYMIVMVLIILTINGITKQNWLEALLFSLSIAVGLTPEMLPLIVSANQIKATNEITKEKTIIKDLSSMQNIGAMDILCTDKTGTLTEDQEELNYYLDINGNTSEYVLKNAYLNSYFQTKYKNNIDEAIIAFATNKYTFEIDKYQKIREIEFEFDRKIISTIIEEGNNQCIITKGSIDEILNISSYFQSGNEIIKMSNIIKSNIKQKIDEYNENGCRVIGVAINNSELKERNMIFIGYLVFSNKLKPNIDKAIKCLSKKNVALKILTGDNEVVTKAVCKKINILNCDVVNGCEIDNISNELLYKKVMENNLFVKLTPEHKAKIVKVLKEKKHIVGFMGDGVNDAMALKNASVSISVDNSLAIVKDVSDIILLKKDLKILDKMISKGRTSFINTIKYVKITASSNFGNMFSVLIASVFLPFLPMLPIQILILNFIYDISCLSLSYDKVDSESLNKPKNFNSKDINSFMKWFGPTSTVFDLITFILLYFVIVPNILNGSYNDLSFDKQLEFMMLFNTGWFIQSLWTQSIVIHILRTNRLSFIKYRASSKVIITTLICITIGTLIPYTPLNKSLNMVSMPLNYYIYLFFIVATYIISVTLIKKIYLKKETDLV